MSRKYIIITYQQTNEAELTLNPSYEIFTCSKFTPWCQNGISLVQLRERKKTESTNTYLFRPLFWILGIPTGSNPNVDMFFPRFCLRHMQKSSSYAFQFLSYKVTSDFLYCVLFIICMI